MALLLTRQTVIIESAFPISTLIELEASISESHKRIAELTDHPIEVGSDTTDHMKFKPRELEITGIISNTPIKPLATFTALPSVPGGDPRSRAEDAYLELENIMEAGSLCTISTTFATYTNMALVGLTTPRDAKRGNIAELQMVWREVRFAETLKIAAPVPVSPVFSARAELGKQSAKAAKAAAGAQASSVLKSLLGSLGL